MEEDTKAYEIRKTMHLGPIRRDIRSGSILEWNPHTALMKIDGNRIPETQQMQTQEAMRMLTALCDRNPDDPPIVPHAALEENDDGPYLPSHSVISNIWSWFAALEAIEQKFNIKHENAKWESASDQQSDYLEFFGARPLGLLSDLFEVEITEDTNVLYVHVVMNLKPEWKYQAGSEESTLCDMVIFENGLACAAEDTVHPYPVVSVLARNGMRVRFALTDSIAQATSDELSLFMSVAQVSAVRRVINDYRQVKVPAVKISHSETLDWAEGLSLNGRTIGKLGCTINFDFTDKGERLAHKANTDYATTGSTYSMADLDTPFLMWVEKDGVEIPIFQALIKKDTWANASF